MNEPSGFTLDSAGKITSVDPWGVIFNKAMPLQALHMIVAAYVVGGFLIASVYAMGMLRGRRDRYHRIGFLIPFTVAIDRSRRSRCSSATRSRDGSTPTSR